MASIDPSIALQVRPIQFDNPLDLAAKAAQYQGLQQQNQLAQLTLQQHQADTDQTNALNQLYQTAVGADGKIDRNALYQGLAQQGMGSRLPVLQKQFADADKASTDVQKTQTEISKNDYDLTQKKRIAGIQSNVALIADPNFSYDTFINHVNQSVQSGETDPQKAAAFVAQAPKDPAQLKTFLTQQLMTTLNPEQQLTAVSPKVDYKDTGGQLTGIQSNPNLPGYGTQVSSIGKTQTPDSRAVDARVARSEVADAASAGANGKAPTDPAQVENIAQMIASGRMAPLSGPSLRTPWGLAAMSRVAEINPDFRSQTFGTSTKAEKDFATGKQGNAVRSFNVSLTHLDTLSNLADALNNNDTQLINKIGNYVGEQTGSPAPTNFNAAKKIVGDEIVKAIVGSGGGVADREEAAKTIQAASSPAQLKGVIATYKELMNGQLNGLSAQYKSTTGRDDFNKYLSPQAQAALNHGKPAAPQAGKPSLDDIFGKK